MCWSRLANNGRNTLLSGRFCPPELFSRIGNATETIPFLGNICTSSLSQRKMRLRWQWMPSSLDNDACDWLLYWTIALSRSVAVSCLIVVVAINSPIVSTIATWGVGPKLWRNLSDIIIQTKIAAAITRASPTFARWLLYKTLPLFETFPHNQCLLMVDYFDGRLFQLIVDSSGPLWWLLYSSSTLSSSFLWFSNRL